MENEYVKRRRKKNPLNAFLPILGLILAIALGAVSYVLSEPLQDFLVANVNNFPSEQEAQIVVGVVLFVVLLLFAALIYAIFAPKPPRMISENVLRDERVQKEKDRVKAKRRRQQLNREAAKRRAEQDKNR